MTSRLYLLACLLVLTIAATHSPRQAPTKDKPMKAPPAVNVGPPLPQIQSASVIRSTVFTNRIPPPTIAKSFQFDALDTNATAIRVRLSYDGAAWQTNDFPPTNVFTITNLPPRRPYIVKVSSVITTTNGSEESLSNSQTIFMQDVIDSWQRGTNQVVALQGNPLGVATAYAVNPILGTSNNLGSFTNQNVIILFRPQKQSELFKVQ